MFCKKTLYFSYFNCIVPSQVTAIAVSKAVSFGKPALRVTWTTPQSDVAISQYQLQYRRIRTTLWIAVNLAPSGSNMSTVLEALDTGTTYQVRIRAVSAIGNGTWSRVESETTYISEFCSKLKNNESSFQFCTDIVALESLSYSNQIVECFVHEIITCRFNISYTCGIHPWIYTTAGHG